MFEKGQRKRFFLSVRISASESVRKTRGWVQDPDKDLHSTECDLDDYVGFDLAFDNSYDSEAAVEAFVEDELIPKI